MKEKDTNKNFSDNKNFERKLDYLRTELLDKEKCREFSQKLCEYINNESNK